MKDLRLKQMTAFFDMGKQNSDLLVAVAPDFKNPGGMGAHMNLQSITDMFLVTIMEMLNNGVPEELLAPLIETQLTNMLPKAKLLLAEYDKEPSNG